MSVHYIYHLCTYDKKVARLKATKKIEKNNLTMFKKKKKNDYKNNISTYRYIIAYHLQTYRVSFINKLR